MSRRASVSESRKRNRWKPQNLKLFEFLERENNIFQKRKNNIVMSVAVKRGALIVFEGCDRSGKTTQASE